MKNLLIGAVCAIAMCFAQAADAQVLIRIGDVIAQPGTTVRVPVSIHSVAGELLGYNFPVEIGEDGRGLPGGLVLARDSANEVETFSNSVGEGHRLANHPLFTWEVVYSDVADIEQDPISLIPQGVHLFDIVIEIPEDYEGYTPIVIPQEGLAQYFLTLQMQGTVGSFPLHPNNIFIDNGSIFVEPDGVVFERLTGQRKNGKAGRR